MDVHNDSIDFARGRHRLKGAAATVWILSKARRAYYRRTKSSPVARELTGFIWAIARHARMK
jgi:hypothetical protein